MSPRPFARMRRAASALILIVAALATVAGCDPRMALYFLQPFEPTIAPTGPNLKGKRVVVVTHLNAVSQSDFPTLDHELTREVVKILRQKVRRIDVVDPSQVATWLEGKPTWSDPAELAEAFEANVVIFLEVNSFQIDSPSSPGMYHGIARVAIRVTELAHPRDHRGRPIPDRPLEATVIHDEVQDTIFPKERGPIPDSGISRAAFKNRFLGLVAAEISWHFVPHTTTDRFQDAQFDW